MYSVLHYWSRINGWNGNLPQTLLPLQKKCIRTEYHLLLTKILKDEVITFETSSFHEESLKVYQKKILKTLWNAAHPFI